MNDKTSMLCALGVLAILFAGIAVFTHQPDTIIVITVPAWLRAAGSVVGFTGMVLWLRRDVWRWIGPSMDAACDWLDDDESEMR